VRDSLGTIRGDRRRGRVARGHITAFLVSGALLAGLVGCGGSSTTPKVTAEARFAAAANEFCRELKSTRATSQSSPALRAKKAKLHELESAIRKEPRIAAFLSDVAARRRALAPFSNLKVPSHTNRASNGGPAGEPINVVLESHRLAVKIRADEKALGLTSCMGTAPRPPIGG
jgi:hypothetical protein